MRRGWPDFFWPLVILSAIGLTWEAIVTYLQVPRYILPGPGSILRVAWERRDLLVDHTLTTLAEIGLGFGLALIVGLILGGLIFWSRIVERSLLPIVLASQTIPVFAIAPLLVLWFGYGLGSKVVMTAIIVFFPIVINTVQGLRAADEDVVALLIILEASNWQVFAKVRLPQALPYIFSGIKIGVTVSTIGAVIGEWVGARKGLGYLMIHANAQLQTELIFAAILYLSILGLGLYVLAAAVERRMTPWRREEGHRPQATGKS